MANLLDSTQFNPVQNDVSFDLQKMIQYARQNPQAFEEQIRRTNPQAYQQAMQMRNNFSPREAIMQIARSKGINPNVLKMFGLG